MKISFVKSSLADDVPSFLIIVSWDHRHKQLISPYATPVKGQTYRSVLHQKRSVVESNQEEEDSKVREEDLESEGYSYLHEQRKGLHN